MNFSKTTSNTALKAVHFVHCKGGGEVTFYGITMNVVFSPRSGFVQHCHALGRKFRSASFPPMMAALCLLYGVFEMKKGTATDLDSKTAKEILDVVQHESDLRREFERLAPNPNIGLVQFIILSVVFVVILLQDSPVAQDYPEVVWLIFIPFLFLLGLIGTESRRIHKRIEALAKIVEN